jgi:hypothetical protein
MGKKPQTRRTVRTPDPFANPDRTARAADACIADVTAAGSSIPVLNLIQRLQAYEEIQNSVGRLAVSVAWHKPDAVLHEFALDRPEVSFEYADEGVFHSARAIRAAIFAALQPLRTGEMIEVHAASPLIEVARDLRSARALFSTPGYGALPREGGLPMATWNWGMLAADYVPYPDGSWKMLSAHYFRLIECSYQGGFVDDLSLINRSQPMHPMAEATTYHHPYSPLTVRGAIPAAPRPYESYNGNGWMLGKA